MGHSPSPRWLAALADLRKRIEQNEYLQRESIQSLKAELAELELQLHQESLGTPPEEVVVQPPPYPVEGAPPVPSLVHLQRAKQEAVPPPLPQAQPPVVPVVGPPPIKAPPLPANDGGSFEMKFGQVWVVRIGIVLLLTGLVLGAPYAYQNWIYHLSAGTRLAGLYFCSLLLAGPGFWLARKEVYKRYGEVLVAGGLAFFYYCTYAAHHVERLRVIESPVTASILLLGAAGLIAAVSWFRNSRTTAIMGIVLASYATMIQPLDWLSAISNLVLALTGILLMLRPGWGGPGIASLAGTYGAFVGWQILGAAGNGQGNLKATLWFLPASWAIFAIPGMLGRFRDSLGDRGRAWFTGANNGLFFLIFSGVWLANYGPQGFWKMPAFFGLVLLAMGIYGRKRDDNAAASNVIQGLAALSLAMVIKLDGYHLALGLSAESLVLALGFHRFRKRAEFVFSLLAGMGAAVMAMYLHQPVYGEAPAWSGALGAVLVGLAAVIFRWNVERAVNPLPWQVRTGASLLAYSSLALLMVGWCFRLSESWQLPVTALLAPSFATVSLIMDKRRWMPEVAWASGVTGLIALFLTHQPTSLAGQIVACLAALAACMLWHRPTHTAATSEGITADPADSPSAFAWLFAGLVPFWFLRIIADAKLSDTWQIGALAAGAVGFVAIARAIKASRLEITATLLNIGALLLVLKAILFTGSDVTKTLAFAPAIAAGAILALVMFRRDAPLLPQVLITRATLFVAWAAALMFAVPRGFIDLMALSAGIAFFFAWRRKHLAPIDAWGWTLLSLLAYLEVLLMGNASRFHGYLYEGIGLVALFAGIALQTPALPESLRRTATKGLPWLACLILTLWSTHICVDVFGWRSIAVLWTILGFGLVSFGLVLNRITSRQVGFVLLSLALLKLFAVDVWDFSTFMRVVSFIALGLALVLLGLFYHRFAPTLKRLIDEAAPPPPN